LSTLIVQLPPRETEQPLSEWQWPELAFVLVDKSGHLQRAGRSALTLLPQAASTVLIAAARDVLLLAANVPPLKGQKLRQALPNIVEDLLIQDPQTCHIALDPVPLADGRRVLGVIDRAWFSLVAEAFEAAGHRRLRVVPASRCLPAPRTQAVPTPEPVAAPVQAPSGGAARTASMGADLALPVPVVAAAYASTSVLALPGLTAMGASGTLATQVELVLARGGLGEGFASSVESAPDTLLALAGPAPLDTYEIGNPGAEPQLASVSSRAARLLPGATLLSFEAYAKRALDASFDLCQFEFESAAWRLDRAQLQRLRVPLLLAAATLAVAVVGVNVHWWQLVHQRNALQAQLEQTLLGAFPKITTVLDPQAQMSGQLDRLRLAGGDLSPDDFVVLSSDLERALGPISVANVAALDYHDRQLEVGFKPGVTIDSGFGDRLAHEGLQGQLDSSTGKWILRSRS
jgi:general secretion pathway protein L